MHMAQTWSERVFKWSTICFQDLFFKFLHMCISGYPPASAVASCQNRSVFFESFHCWLWLASTFQEETPRLLWLSAQYWRFDAQAPSESRRSASVWDVLEWTRGKGARRGRGPARCQGKPKKEMLGRSCEVTTIPESSELWPAGLRLQPAISAFWVAEKGLVESVESRPRKEFAWMDSDEERDGMARMARMAQMAWNVLDLSCALTWSAQEQGEDEKKDEPEKPVDSPKKTEKTEVIPYVSFDVVYNLVHLMVLNFKCFNLITILIHFVGAEGVTSRCYISCIFLGRKKHRMLLEVKMRMQT